MHKITDQIKLLMAKKNHQIGEMRGKVGGKLNKGKNKCGRNKSKARKKIKRPTLSHLLTVS